MYGIDVDDDELLTRRTWRWLQARIGGLLNVQIVAPDGTLVPATRLGWALRPPMSVERDVGRAGVADL